MTPREQILHNVNTRWKDYGTSSTFHQAIKPLANDVGSNLLTALVSEGLLQYGPNGSGGRYWPVGVKA